MSLRAFLSRGVVTPEGVRAAAIVVEGERIREVVDAKRIPADVQEILDFGDAAILPGLVDSHVHINDPGRADWEGFETATRAAAAGGYTLLVDMPLNCLPATTDVPALEAKRIAAKGRCRVDWMAWGGVVEDNSRSIEPLAEAGVAGFKCFLVHPGIDGFTMVTEEQLRVALPHVARSGLPLLVHAELPGPIDGRPKDWRARIGHCTKRFWRRGRKKRNWRRFECFWRCAANSVFGCTLSIYPRARRLRSCVKRGRQGWL